MGETTTAPNAAAVSRVLGKRHTRSTSHGTRVRGYRAVTEGFTVTEAGTSVRVEHQRASGAYRPEVDYADIAVRACARYAETLRTAGYIVEVRGTGTSTSVSVTARTR